MAETIIKYFGTDISASGHFVWDVWKHSIAFRGLNFGKIPFNPEDIVSSGTPFGTVKFEHIGNFSVLSISGSCSDKRHGSKSVFWAPRKVPYEVFKKWITELPSTKEILENMPFQILWNDIKIRP